MLQTRLVLWKGAGPHDSSGDLPQSLVQTETFEFVTTGGRFFPATLQLLPCSTDNVIILPSGLPKRQGLVQALLCSLLA